MGVVTADLTQFLAVFAKDELTRLRTAYPGPNEQSLFDESEKMRALQPLQKAKVELAISSLNEFVQRWTKVSGPLTSTLGRSNIWELAGGVLAACGGGGALSLILVNPGETMLAAASSGIALAGGLITLTVKFLRKDLYGRDNAVIEAHQKLASGSAKAMSLTRELRPYLVSDDDGDDTSKIDTLVGQANSLIADLEGTLAGLPAAVQ